MSNDLKEDKGYQVFSDLMDAVFELSYELNDRDEEDLTENEIKLLEAMDAYCANACEEMEE